jgi:hypothetical protein
MPVSGDVTFTAQTRFSNNLRLELGQHTSMLASRALTRDEAGSEKVKLDNLISASKTKKKTTRHGPVEYGNTGHDGIWVAKPESDYFAELVDTDDKLMTGVDIQGGYVTAASSAINRAKDDAFLAGFYGDMITGKQGTVLNPFPSGNVIAATVRDSGSGPTGQNVKKLRGARKKLAQNFVDMNQVFNIALTAQQIDDLYSEISVQSIDYQQSVKARFSADGKSILGAAGFDFVEMELGNPLLENSGLTLNGSGQRKNPFWSADGMVMNYWEELFTSVDHLPQQHHEAQVYARTCGAASRTDQNRCGYIENVE